jgi:hypothetical protein
MVEHGDYDITKEKWFCRYWMDESTWREIHGYAPIHTSHESDLTEQVNNDELDP